jgi:hypothetical protein
LQQAPGIDIVQDNRPEDLGRDIGRQVQHVIFEVLR